MLRFFVCGLVAAIGVVTYHRGSIWYSVWQEVADDMISKAREMTSNPLLSTRHSVQIALGLAHILTMQVPHSMHRE